MAHDLTQRHANNQQKLTHYYKHIHDVILARQHPITGLFPASTAVTSHGNYTDAWVRDNVYSILAVWGMGLAFDKVGGNRGTAFELKQSTVKLMRGLLIAMMKQADKVERFKRSQNPLDALHAKYDTATGNTVVDDDKWGHLQLDATSLYLLMLAQMTASGLQLIYTLDEVNFIQNLIYYIGRTYRTPDYGIWERGNKINTGQVEVNASSVAMAKAALESLDGLDLFGACGSQASVLHVNADDIARSRVTLEAMLPRESGSKEVDAALLSAISFPAFAVADEQLTSKTRTTIIQKLQGDYGLKRFLRDGHQTVLEDPHRLHYEPEELKQFANIESEWPLFFCYLYLDALFRRDHRAKEQYRARLLGLLIEQDGHGLLPELYFVSKEHIDAERQEPHSQPRRPNENIPLVWAQSLYLLGRLIDDGLLSPIDIDPLQRHLPSIKQQPTVQMALLAENEIVQATLAEQGILSQTTSQVEDIEVYPPSELARLYREVGRNDKLGLSGRPNSRMRTLQSSRMYLLRNQLTVFLPILFDEHAFYQTLDSAFMAERIRQEISYLHQYWQQPGRPTLVLMITHAMLEQGDPLVTLLHDLQHQYSDDTPVRLAPLRQLLSAATLERIDDLHHFSYQLPINQSPPVPQVLSHTYSTPLERHEQLAFELTLPEALEHHLATTTNLEAQIEILANLKKRVSLYHPISSLGNATVATLLQELYIKASETLEWALLRQCAALLERINPELMEALSFLLVHQKRVLIGKAYSEASLIHKHLPLDLLVEKLHRFTRDDARDFVLTQEVIIALAGLMKRSPQLFKDTSTLRVGHFILLMTSALAREQGLEPDDAYDVLMHTSPSDISARLSQVLRGTDNATAALGAQESLHSTMSLQFSSQPNTLLPWGEGEDEGGGVSDWWTWRKHQGALLRVRPGFYPRVWELLKHCKGVLIGEKLERRNRLESARVLAEMTPQEQNFALLVEHLLSKINAIEYRQLNVEVLEILSRVASKTPELYVNDIIVLDVLIGHAVRIAYLADHSHHTLHYEQHKAEAWSHFYTLPPHQTQAHMFSAFRYLLQQGVMT